MPQRLTEKDYRRAAKQANIPYRVLLAVLGQEGGQNPDGSWNTSRAGARGPAQLMPGTAQGLEKRYKGLDTSTSYGNLLGGAYYLREQWDRFKTLELALAAYNAGPGAVKEYGDVPPYAETQRYVRNIMAKVGVIKGTGKVPHGGGGQEVPSSPAAPSLSGPTLPVLPSITPSDVALQGVQDIAEGDWNPTRALQGLVDAQAASERAMQQAAQAPRGQVQSSEPMPAVAGGSFKVPKDIGKWVKVPKPAGQWPAPGQEILSFTAALAKASGRPLSVWDTSTHSRMTVNGNVSAHTTGSAVDIPAAGNHLIRLGRLALMQAGMPRREAMKAKGGLYNVGGYQIIFNTQIGGDHTDHLHAARRR